MAWKREIGCTMRVCGYEAVNTGSKMAARYRQSSGEVKDDAMRVEGWGRRFLCLASELSRKSVQASNIILIGNVLPSLYTINLEINPPYARNAQQNP